MTNINFNKSSSTNLSSSQNFQSEKMMLMSLENEVDFATTDKKIDYLSQIQELSASHQKTISSSRFLRIINFFSLDPINSRIDKLVAKILSHSASRKAYAYFLNNADDSTLKFVLQHSALKKRSDFTSVLLSLDLKDNVLIRMINLIKDLNCAPSTPKDFKKYVFSKAFDLMVQQGRHKNLNLLLKNANRISYFQKSYALYRPAIEGNVEIIETLLAYGPIDVAHLKSALDHKRSSRVKETLKKHLDNYLEKASKNHIAFDQSSIDLKKSSKELKKIAYRFSGCCELICNLLLVQELLGNCDEQTLKTKVNASTLDIKSIIRSHILNVYSFWEKILALVFSIYPNNILSKLDQQNLVVDQIVNRKVLFRSLERIEIGKTLKLEIFKAGFSGFNGHSCLIKKTSQNEFIFFDPNYGEIRGISENILANLIDDQLQLWVANRIFITSEDDFLNRLQKKHLIKETTGGDGKVARGFI